MNTEIAVKEQPSVIADMAQRFGMDRKAFEATLKATVVPANTSNEQFAAFLLVAKQYNLNPITKEIYAFPAKGGGIQPIVGIDGWCNIINSHPQLDGIEFEDIKDEKGKLTSISCKIFRKDRAHPVTAIEYMGECKRDTQPWNQWPARMLRHKALIQAARYAFGFSGIVDPDEADRMVDVTPEKQKAFANSKEREKYITEAINNFNKAKTIDDVEKIYADNRNIMDIMVDTGWNPDVVGGELIMRAYHQAKEKFTITNPINQEEIIASYGQGFADTPYEDATALPEEETKPISKIPFKRINQEAKA